MTRFLLFLIVVTLLVSMRLVFLRLRAPSPGISRREARPPTIEGKVTGPGALELRSIEFDNFDAEMGPVDPMEFFERMRVTVGRAREERSSCFDLYVTTARGVSAYMKKNGVAHQFGRDLLVVERYDIEAIRAAVVERLDDLPHVAEQAS